jgi:hypothetical protein
VSSQEVDGGWSLYLVTEHVSLPAYQEVSGPEAIIPDTPFVAMMAKWVNTLL